MIVILPIFSDHTCRTMKAFIHNWIQDEIAFRYCCKRRGLFVHKVVPKSTENYTFHAANSKVFVNIFRALKVAKNILMIMNTTASVQRQNMLVYLSLELSVPRGSRFPSRKRSCLLTSIRAYFCAK